MWKRRVERRRLRRRERRKEICGNGKDDDCDCVVDECNTEICNNGIDDDGDGLIDKDDPACATPN